MNLCKQITPGAM